MRAYKTIRALRRGETVTLEGETFRMSVGANGEEEDIQPGDFYIAERNTGPRLLTCAKNVDPRGWIQAVENAYPFDTGECVKVAWIQTLPMVGDNPPGR